jgi:uncharacterized surface protein with fasciclin (FAS1) repeats
MKNIFKNRIQQISFTLVVALLGFSACNKGFDKVPATAVVSTDLTLGEKINADPNYSILRNALNRSGLINIASTKGNSLTIYAPDNNAFIASGLSDATVSVLPLASLTPLMQYHIITSRMPSSTIPATFPNVQMPTYLQLPGGNPLVRMNAFPAKNGANFFVNNMPVVQSDAVTGSNGVMHRIPFILQPPQQVVKQLITADANLTLFSAIVQRGDVGQPAGLTRLDSVMNFGIANITVFAPDNNSIKGLINVLSGGAIPLAAPDATFLGFIASTLPVANARGVVAYHMLGSRAYSVNLPLATGTIQTLVGAPPFPQLTVDRSTALPRLLGAANGAGNYSNFTATDRNAVNGVLHVIDRVLLPQ